MRASEWIIVGYLAYLAVLAWILPIPGRRRRLVTIAAIVNILCVVWLSAPRSVSAAIARDWFPALQILVGYWLSGAFFLRPMPRAEAWLAAGDRWLFDRIGAGQIARRGPRVVLEYLELAYLMVYLMVPLGFGVAYWLAEDIDVDRYWTIVLIAELVCYGMLPWVQTRPPRALRLHAEIEDRRVGIHRLNALVLKLGSIQVNTFPSGHAAGAFATALALGELVPAALVPFLVLAASITIGSVIGRYHYAADSLCGVVVALIAWMAVQ